MARLVAVMILALLTRDGAWSVAHAADWPMGGRNATRNPVSPEKAVPTDWQIKDDDHQARNILWSVRVGTRAIGGPVVANGLVWVGTNNDEPLEQAIKGDRGVLACFRESDGKFLYQYTAPRLVPGSTADWPGSGSSGSPVIEGDKLWFITNRREVVCLDTRPLTRGEGPAKEVWKYDLMKEQGVFPNSPMIPGHNNLGSMTIYKELLFVPTGNGFDENHRKVKVHEAPSLMCLEKATGKVVWKDNSPGENIYGGHHASPLVIEIVGKAQVIHPEADGWVRSFDALTGKLIWKFDTNKKDTEWGLRESGQRAKRAIVATPVYAEGRVFVAAGREPEFCHGPGCLFCIDPTKSGDISPELDDGKGKGSANPNSGLIWEFKKDGDKGSDLMHQTTSSVAVHDGLVIAPDRVGYIHCLDAKTGKRYWTHDTRDSQFGDPLIADGKVYVANESVVTILELSKTRKVIAKHEMNDVVVAPPVLANGILYVLTERRLYAIGARK